MRPQDPPRRQPAPVILYTSFGPGPHVEELIFSASSAQFRCAPTDRVRIVIFTDDPAPFEPVKAECVVIDPATFDSWIDHRGYIYRLKICALAEALRRFNAPVAMVDADTYFLQSPQRLFDRIGPGRTLMHLPEGPIGHLVALGHERHQLVTHRVPTDNGGLQLHRDWVMWNSGVVGVHPTDLPLVEASLKLNDAIRTTTGHKNSEQMAFTEIFRNHTALSSSRDIVFHYFLPFLRNPFRKELHELLAEAATLPESEQAPFLYAHRPRPSLKKRLSASIKRPLKRMGYFKSDLNTSV